MMNFVAGALTPQRPGIGANERFQNISYLRVGKTTDYARESAGYSKGGSEMSEFGKWLKGLRQQQDLTLEDLGDLTGSHHSSLSRYEKGRGGTPGMEIVRKIARALSPERDDRHIRSAAEALAKDVMAPLSDTPIRFVYDAEDAEFLDIYQNLQPSLRRAKLEEMRAISTALEPRNTVLVERHGAVSEDIEGINRRRREALVFGREDAEFGNILPPRDDDDSDVRTPPSRPAGVSRRTPSAPAS